MTGESWAFGWALIVYIKEVTHGEPLDGHTNEMSRMGGDYARKTDHVIRELELWVR